MMGRKSLHVLFTSTDNNSRTYGVMTFTHTHTPKKCLYLSSYMRMYTCLCICLHMHTYTQLQHQQIVVVFFLLCSSNRERRAATDSATCTIMEKNRCKIRMCIFSFSPPPHMHIYACIHEVHLFFRKLMHTHMCVLVLISHDNCKCMSLPYKLCDSFPIFYRSISSHGEISGLEKWVRAGNRNDISL